MLITLSIFSVVAVISVTLMVNGLRSAKKIQYQVLLYSEAQAVMDQMERDVERNTIDYEAYYSMAVKGSSGWETPRYGQYAQTFYNPGSDGTEAGPYSGLSAYGATYYKTQCPSDSSLTYPTDCPNELPVRSQQDRKTGTHPFAGIDSYTSSTSYYDDPTYMNAFCESPNGSTDCNDLAYGVQEDLILVNARGDSRIVYTLRPQDSSDPTAGMALGKMVLSGTDTDNNGVVDTWICSPSYESYCGDTNGGGNPMPEDENDFITLTPENIDIKQFYLIINPVEDPYRAFGEAEEQSQPQVTILLEASLSDAASQGLLGEVPSIFIQRTISTGVYSEIPSYE